MCEKKQKVLIVHNYYQIPGGEDTVVANEKKLLEDHGHEVVLYTRHNSEMNSLTKFQKILLPFSTIFNGKTYREIKELIKKEDIEIVHVHNTLNMVSPSVYYAAFSCKVPVVQTVHNFRLLCPGATFFRDGHVCEECLEKGLSCAVKHKCYRGSRVQTLACVVSMVVHRMLGTYRKLNYICLTEFNKEKLRHLKQIKKDRIFVKSNFVQAADKIVPYSERKDQFVYVGRLEEIKGMDILLEAWKIMGEFAPKLYMCGKGPLEEWCKQYIKENHLTMIEMLGFVPNDQTRKLVGESKALILPTQVYEGFPMTILEAMSVGTPVIGSKLGNVGTLIKDNVNGICFRYDSAEELANAVKKIDVSQESVLECYEELYSVEVNYNRLMDIYDTVIF